MVPMNLAKVTLFLVVLLIAFATSQPFSRSSHGTTTRRNGFEWNTRKIGTKKVATISIRKDEERDRRSVILTEDSDSDLSATFVRPHQHHQTNPATSSQSETQEERKRPRHYHRHHHGEEGDTDDDDVEWLLDGEGGIKRSKKKGRRRNKESRSRGEIGEVEDPFDEGSILGSDRELTLNEVRPYEMRMAEGAADTSTLHEILSSVGLDIDAEMFKNVTSIDRRKRKNDTKKSGKKKQSKKVKRDKRRRRNRGKKGRSKGRRKKSKNTRKCKHLKGKKKKKCRADAKAKTEADVFSISMSGSEACQYHNLKECSGKVGFLKLDSDSLLTVVKCHYREEFFDCMEELRLETCDPNFETKGDMKALRKRIRDAIHTTNSCLISEVIEG